MASSRTSLSGFRPRSIPFSTRHPPGSMKASHLASITPRTIPTTTLFTRTLSAITPHIRVMMSPRASLCSKSISTSVQVCNRMSVRAMDKANKRPNWLQDFSWDFLPPFSVFLFYMWASALSVACRCRMPPLRRIRLPVCRRSSSEWGGVCLLVH